MRCVPAHDFTVAKALQWRSAIDESPPYQRAGSIWSLEKQQLFIDSLLNGYDVPKIYFHDLRGRHPTKVYAIVDGRQRLTTIWRFLTDGLALAQDFRAEPANLPDLPPGVPSPAAGSCFSQMHPAWQEVLRTTFLAVVLIKNATENDIEDLFSRLNNGEPLNAAEKRNAMGGAVARLIRELARHDFFTSRLQFNNDRYHYYDVAARLLLIDHAGGEPGDIPDLGSRSLDAFVKGNRNLPEAQGRALLGRATTALDLLCAVFEPGDPLLTSQAHPPLYYLFARSLLRAATRPDPALIRSFLERFEAKRRAELQRDDDRQDPALIEFSHLMHHGTHEQRSLARRLEILARRFGQDHPELSRGYVAAS